jgi:hypothetical protein
MEDGIMTKIRGIIVVDMDIDGGFKECAKAEESLEQIMKDYVKGNSDVKNWQVQCRERRGDIPPDISKMKFRSN